MSTALAQQFLENRETMYTKRAFIGFWFKNLFEQQKDARVIVFSESPAALRELGASLEQMGVRCAFLQGQVYRRLNAIRSFKEPESDVRVIMLSLSKVNSFVSFTFLLFPDLLLLLVFSLPRARI